MKTILTNGRRVRTRADAEKETRIAMWLRAGMPVEKIAERTHATVGQVLCCWHAMQRQPRPVLRQQRKGGRRG